jgi:hypothetical protein
MQTERIDIAKARELLEGTTKGEWGTDGLYLVKYVDKDDIVYHSRFLAEFDLGNEANALWIAHCHNHYAALLDELEGARALTATARGVLCALLQRINEAAEQSTAYVVEPDIERMVANAYQAMLTQEGRT